MLQLQFSVRDTGIGIPADRLDRLFKSFSQADSSTTHKFGGTGLGRAISQRRATLMGGRMWVESPLGLGSTFHFIIAAAPHTQSVRVNISAKQPNLTGLRVLIVDDNETNRRILMAQTRSWGMTPTAVDSGPAALQLLAQGGNFDLALLDCQMPGLDGEKLAAQIKRRPGTGRLPLLLLSSAGRRPTPGLFAASLAKPVKPALLLAALGEIFHRPTNSSGTTPSVTPSAQLAQHYPLQILLADDNSVNLKVAQMMLKRLGYQADPAANGREVLAALERTSYDVILMDLQMPELDGLATTRLIRAARPGVGDQPWIIAQTASALQEDRDQARGAGLNDFLTKPFLPEQLAAALERAGQHLAPRA